MLTEPPEPDWVTAVSHLGPANTGNTGISIRERERERNCNVRGNVLYPISLLIYHLFSHFIFIAVQYREIVLRYSRGQNKTNNVSKSGHIAICTYFT